MSTAGVPVWKAATVSNRTYVQASIGRSPQVRNILQGYGSHVARKYRVSGKDMIGS